MWRALPHPEFPDKELPGKGYATYAVRVVGAGAPALVLTSRASPWLGRLKF